MEIEADWPRTYEAMFRNRVFDRTALALQRQGVIEAFSESRGQEAAIIGGCVDLQPGDMFFPDARCAGAALLRGVSVAELLDWFRGEDYCPWDWRERGYYAHPIPVGVQTGMATGWAWAARLADEGTVAVAAFGDGAASQGEVHEAMNYAGVFAAPVVFLLLNNGWAISTPASKQTRAETLSRRADGYGFEGETIDGNEVGAVRTAVSRAVEKARAGGGPTLIEAITYRMGGHTSSDDPKRYRSDAEMTTWEARDPVARSREAILSADPGNEERLTAIESAVEDEMTRDIDDYLERLGRA
jgi:2-oxoisovalerate dehydrogenase E1 component alpha subunit